MALAHDPIMESAPQRTLSVRVRELVHDVRYQLRHHGVPSLSFRTGAGDDRLRVLSGDDGHTVGVNGREVKLFFVCAHPRSGTSWTKSLLNLHSDVHCEGEGRYESLWSGFYSLGINPWHTASREPQRSVALVCLQDSVRAIMAASALQHDGIGWIGDQTPRRLVPIIPSAPHIWLVRDGRDVVVSLTFHKLSNPQAWGWPIEAYPGLVKARDAFSADKHCFEKHPELLLADADWVRDAAKMWADHQMHDLSAAKAIEREGRTPLLRLRYEDLHADTEGERERIYTFLGLDAANATALTKGSRTTPGFETEDAKSFYRHGAVGDSKNYFLEPASERRFDDEAGDAMAALGYQTTNQQ